ncbi:hypothetical protein [Enterobacter hormaechei]|uniref:hypothetical protein n=1 Tax=Enterobacter hormaechei TaxID=158836 RepID=UPI002075FC07|nr:hypothetical protein [Enterobacter hormaechei]MCM7958362.1 hypothetical protein [Enterobacter hormaechei]MCM7968065.1 hypothetical protein [Enterobacter hormaechei]MCM7981883.1 hypothetical protein [Enterobacter hormaechei]MCM7985415.1 hypothetical protein [Enterobacter hormaechei]
MSKKSIAILIVLITITLLLIPCYLYWDTFHRYGISSSNQDWSNFGSFFGGIYGALFGSISTIILCITLYFTVTYNRSQLSQLQADSLRNLIVHHIDSLNEKMNNRTNKYYSPLEREYKIAAEEHYLPTLKGRFLQQIEVDKRDPNWQFDDLKIAGKVIRDLKLSYPEELAAILNIINIIKNIDDIRLRIECINLFRSMTYRERTFWLVCYAYYSNDIARKTLIAFPDLIKMPDGFTP